MELLFDEKAASLRNSIKFYAYVGFALLLLVASWQWNVSKISAGHTKIPARAIRLRILANSDMHADQAVKLKVRDAVVASMNQWTGKLKAPATMQEAKAVIRSHMPEVSRIVGHTLAANGFSYGYKVELGIVPFPSKIYGSRVYPAGNYEALRITLGRGAGQNWWCVLFPPLCFINSDSGDAVPQAELAKAAVKSPDAMAVAHQGAAAKQQHKAAAGKSKLADTGKKGKVVHSAASISPKAADKPKVRFFLWDLLQKLLAFFRR